MSGLQPLWFELSDLNSFKTWTNVSLIQPREPFLL